jgi:hypothetical protein
MYTPVSVLCFAAALTACAPAHRPAAAVVVPIFGPAISRDVISGRADDPSGAVWLMVGGTSLVRLDLTTHERREVRLDTRGGDPWWGLARLTDGSMWALDGRNALIEINP